MKHYLDSLPKDMKDLIHLASDIANRNNLVAYLVGGFVRDLILGKKNLDLDIVVEGDGIRFAEDFANTLKAKLIRHRRFGTATVILPYSNSKVDIASTRKEFYPQAAHLPLVEKGTLKDDLSRRDFTINAMAISITKDCFGKLIDFFDGKKDLYNKKIRILHNLSFIDDPTRILRAIRFEQRYNFRIESKTLKDLKKAIRLKMLEKVEPQRIRDELFLMLKEERSLNEIKRILELLGFDFINPHLKVSKKTYLVLQSIGAQINWFKSRCLLRRQLETWLIYFMGFIDSLNMDETKKLCQRFSFRKRDEIRILNYKKIRRNFIFALSQEKIKPSKVFSLLDPLSYEAILLLKAKYKNQQIQRHIEDFFEVYNHTRISVSGDDLYKLDIAPGPRYQEILKKVLNAKLNGLVKTKEEELAFVKKLIKIK